MPVLTFKVDRQSAQRIRAKARAAKSSVSAYLRKAALGEETPAPVRIVRRKHPVSGLPYNAAPTRPVTSEEIRAALADFP
jgi:hypothetical protein